MLDRIRGARVSRRAALIVILLALVVWGAFVYANVQDFVPEELTEPVRESRP